MAINPTLSRWMRIGGASTLALASLMLISLLYKNRPVPPEKFTTNIDLKNKKINDVSVEKTEDSSWPFLNNLLDNSEKWLSQNFNIWKLYQNLANPSSRYVVLNSGLRKEEVAAILAKELGWNDDERYIFIVMDQRLDKKNMEGYYTPGSYIIPNSAKPSVAYKTIMTKFDEEIKSQYASSTAQIINIDLALKIASIIEREAGGKDDMRLISGVIWNRIFKEMRLEMDATLQYAKGNSKDGWWTNVESKDKYIDSPYNTYKNAGLPPTPISNVSISAIKAALNPKKTKCIFYLHDRRGNIHCSVTYKEHLANIKKYYK